MLVSFPVGLFSSSSSIIKSVQSVSITIAAAATTGTATIASVTTANTAIFYGGTSQAHTTINSSTDFAGVSLTNSTTVTATRNTADASNALVVNCSVVEFQTSAIKSVQSGTITMTATTSATATITSVTTTNAVVIYNGSTCTNTGSSPSAMFGSLTLTNATTVTAQRGGAASNLTVYFCVLEFNSGILNSSTQAGTINMNAVTSNTATITGVTTSQAMLVWNGFTSTHAGGAEYAQYPYIALTNGTTVTGTRQDAGGTNGETISFSVIEFKAANVKSLQRGTGVLGSGEATHNTPITAVSTSKAFANWLGETSSSTSTLPAVQAATAALTSSTNVAFTRNTSDTSTVTTSYEVVEFN